MPYAIASQIAYPDRQCVAFVGDGGFSMLMAEFVTCVKYQLPIKVVIVKNERLRKSQSAFDFGVMLVDAYGNTAESVSAHCAQKAWTTGKESISLGI